jgi:hypothetical protein
MSVRFEGVNLNPRVARQGLKKSRIGSRRGARLLIWNPIPARAPNSHQQGQLEVGRNNPISDTPRAQ